MRPDLPTCLTLLGSIKKAKLRAGINSVAENFEGGAKNMEDRREVCLEEEVARLRRSGMSTREIAREMGLDEGWVEGLISLPADEAPSSEDRG